MDKRHLIMALMGLSFVWSLLTLFKSQMTVHATSSLAVKSIMIWERALESKDQQQSNVSGKQQTERDATSKKASHQVLPASNTSLLNVLILTKTGPGNFERRELSRELWFSKCNSSKLFGKSTSPHQAESRHLQETAIVECLFVAGVSENETVMEALRKESATKGDLLLAPFVDGYGRLTLKSMWSLAWSLNRENRFGYIMLVDDDAYLALHNLIPWLLRQPVNSLYSGHRHGKSTPIVQCSADPRNPNCVSTIPRFLNGGPFYAPFASGFAWVLSRDVVARIVHEAMQYILDGEGLPGNVDDAMVGGLANATGVSLLDEPGFIHYADEQCPKNVSIIALGGAPDKVLRKMMKNARAGKPPCFGL